MENYKIFDSKTNPLTPARRRDFPTALKRVEDWRQNIVRVNKFYFDFDFADGFVYIYGAGHHGGKYKIVRA